MEDIDIIWQQCLLLLKDHFGDNSYNTWFRQLKIRINNNVIEVVASNRLIQDFIKNKYWEKINAIMTGLSNGLKINLVVDDNSKHVNINKENIKENPPIKDSHIEYIKQQEEFARLESSQYANKSKREVNDVVLQATKLNPNYTFNTLIRGNSNQLAYAIGMHVTQKPGNKNHNPLFIYGGVGLGKTHLMQAIGNQIYKNNPKAKIRYLHANDYIQDVVKASIRHSFDDLKKYYNNLDLLLMDDIQFIAGDKTKTQEEFFYTFNTLIERNKQVIMTCDTYPKNIDNLNERLISRFTSGLTVEIQPPELEMRVAILKYKAEQNNVTLEDDVAFFIGQNIKSNVRELEGALNKVIYHAQFSNKGISLAIAKEALLDILAIESRMVSIDDIQKTVCDFYKIKISDLLSTKRTQSIARPRQVAMTLAKELTQHSLPTIGNAFGGRDHTTVIHAQKTIASLRKNDGKIDREYTLLTQMLNH